MVGYCKLLTGVEELRRVTNGKRAMNSLKKVQLTICCLGLSILLGACAATNNWNEQSVITFWNEKLNSSFDQEDVFVKALFPSLKEVTDIYSIPYYQLVFFSSEEALLNQKDLLSTDTEANGSNWVSCGNVAVVFPNKYFDEFVEINEKEWCNSESEHTTPSASNELDSESSLSKSEKALSDRVLSAQALVEKNMKYQDSCYERRTFNGDEPEYARAICVARYPTSLDWALSRNHDAEQSCYETRVWNGDNEINARSICLSRYPIR